jgi:Na+/proline symporter
MILYLNFVSIYATIIGDTSEDAAKSNVGAIVGGVVAGLFIIALVVMLIVVIAIVVLKPGRQNEITNGNTSSIVMSITNITSNCRFCTNVRYHSQC